MDKFCPYYYTELGCVCDTCEAIEADKKAEALQWELEPNKRYPVTTALQGLLETDAE